MSIAGRTKYSNYNKHILESGTNTSTINNQRNKVWFHFIRESLLPLIKARDALISYFLTIGIGKGYSSEVKLQLSFLQLSVYDAIAVAKEAWSDHQAEKYTPWDSNPRKRGRLFVLYLEETWVATPRSPLCGCAYTMGNWRWLMQKIPPYLAHTFTGYLTIIYPLVGLC